MAIGLEKRSQVKTLGRGGWTVIHPSPAPCEPGEGLRRMLLKVIWKNVVIRHRLDLVELRHLLHVASTLSRPGGCQSLMTEVYYILPNKVTKYSVSVPYLSVSVSVSVSVYVFVFV